MYCERTGAAQHQLSADRHCLKHKVKRRKTRGKGEVGGQEDKRGKRGKRVLMSNAWLMSASMSAEHSDVGRFVPFRAWPQRAPYSAFVPRRSSRCRLGQYVCVGQVQVVESCSGIVSHCTC